MLETESVTQSRRRARSVVAVILVVLTSLSIVVASVGFWNRYVALDTDAFMEVVEPALTSEEFTSELSERLAEAAIEALDLEGLFEERFTAIDEFLGERLIEALDPGEVVLEILSRLDIPKFADLAAPLSSAINLKVESAIDSFVRSDEFQTALPALVRKGHETFVALATDVESLENLNVIDGEVRWNILPLVGASIEWVIEEGILPEGEEFEIPDLSEYPLASAGVAALGQAVGVDLPDDFGQVTVMTEAQLNRLQTAAETFQTLLWVFTATVVVLVAGSLLVSPHRRRTVIQLAVGSVIGVVLAALAVGAIVEAMRRSIPDPGVASAFLVASDLVTTSLHQVWLMIVILAIISALAAFLAGRLPRTSGSAFHI